MITEFKILSHYDQKDFHLVVLSAEISMTKWIWCYMASGRLPPSLPGAGLFGIWYQN